MKVQSVHSIEITLAPGKRATRDAPAERPRTQTIPANALFEIEDGEELKELRAAKAVKDPDGKHKIDLTVSQPQGSMQTGARIAAGSTVMNPSNPAPAGAKPSQSANDAAGVGQGANGGNGGGEGGEDEEDLHSMTRAELDALAASEGVSEPEKLANKQAVIDAIEEGRLV